MREIPKLHQLNKGLKARTHGATNSHSASDYTAGLVNMPEAWKYSSLVDYQGIRNGTLINKARAKLYVEW